MKVLNYVLDISAACGGFHSVETPPEKASNSEIRRWIKQSAVQINGKPCTDPNAELQTPVTSLILFPKSRPKDGKMSRRTTLL